VLLWAALGAIALWALLRLGNQTERKGRGQWRVAATILAACALAGAAYAGLRGSYLTAAVLAVVGVWITVASRRRPVERSRGADREGMDVAEARSILGVGPAASPDEIRSAYLRLIRAVHPDAGGSEGLAARLNAARDRLLRS
jgi:hypothetical protein